MKDPVLSNELLSLSRQLFKVSGDVMADLNTCGSEDLYQAVGYLSVAAQNINLAAISLARHTARTEVA